ncbi:hypothetical protein [Noviherbaspirillum suwonense]|uniref:hypothetical protein n=1 Tax=Noviherbaspirillum suwonense TaxID=1224511 RepID=UPI0024B6FD00|nr:hypothetical protein [Noviherbaspirillum suwonense]
MQEIEAQMVAARQSLRRTVKWEKELRYIPVVPGTANYINQRRSPKPALAQEKKGKEENKKD